MSLLKDTTVPYNAIASGQLPIGAQGSTYIFPGANTLPITNGSNQGTLILNGAQADININGKSLKGWMEKVEQHLAMLTLNPALEAEWEELKQLGDRYRELENICKQKATMWQKLKTVQPRQD